MINAKMRHIDPNLMIMPKRESSSDHQVSDEDEDVDSDDEYNFDPGEISRNIAICQVIDEKKLTECLLKAKNDNFRNVLVAVQSELYEDFDGLGAYSFGLGALVFALSSIDCIPFDGDAIEINAENFPFLNPRIEFYAPVARISLLLRAAEQADTRLTNASAGRLVVSSEDIRKFNLMAEYITTSLEA
jgi:hypothetical protein